MRPIVLFMSSIFALPLAGGILPGFRIEHVAPAKGFVTSLAFDAQDRLHYSVTTGEIYRLDGSASTRLAKVETASTGNAVLLGIAFREGTIVAHHVTPDLTADVISLVDSADGSVTELARFPCANGLPCSTEHHGGNPVVGPDGSIWFGIGDFGGGHLAQRDDSPGGKIWRIAPDGSSQQFAKGLRNPYDLAVHPAGSFLIVGDNGPEGDDEITLVREGENHGWPATVGNRPAVEGMTPPAYVFPGTVAPTGVTLAHGLVPGATSLLVGTFVTKALYLFPDIDAGRWEPVVLFSDLPQLGGFNVVLDVAQDARGGIWVATPGGIYRLHVPMAGDVDGDGRIDDADLEGLAHELVDGDGPSVLEIHGGSYPGSWGADVNRDGIVDTRDVVAWVTQAKGRQRPVKH